MTARQIFRLEVFIGTWNTTGVVLASDGGPPGALVATDTYRWLPGGHFIVHDADARFDGQPTRSMEVIGFDAGKGRLIATSYDDQGVTDHFVVALDGRRWTIDGRTVRFDGTFDTRKDRLSGLWERKVGRTWQPWIELLLVRA